MRGFIFPKLPERRVVLPGKYVSATLSCPRAWSSSGRSSKAMRIVSHLDLEKGFQKTNKHVFNKIWAAGCLLMEKKKKTRVKGREHYRDGIDLLQRARVGSFFPWWHRPDWNYTPNYFFPLCNYKTKQKYCMLLTFKKQIWDTEESWGCSVVWLHRLSWLFFSA